ncbi:MAG: WecB/TagA/CpsF family glycosyltransferase [Candidatus Gracilibacteria bacterium]|nr:WecB/TagA/CpsF family glycosyltransferase [Candidatus Gracilibacteria bacterium]
MKKQEKSILHMVESCANIKLGLAVGSSFDYFIGFQTRAPDIFRRLGLEWLYRIITGPSKIQRVKRIYNAIFVFLFHVLFSK